MKEQVSLTVRTRDAKGKGPNRRMRAEKLVPGIYYDDKGLNIPVVVEDLPFRKVLKKVGSSRVFDLVIDADGQTQTHPSLIWVVQNHPWKNQVDHVDFYGVDPKKPIHVNVAVEITGKAKGVAVGGKLEIHRETIEVVCLPADIPDRIVIDVTELAMGQHVDVKSVAMPQGVKAVYDQNFAVVGVINPAAEAGEEEGAAAK